MLLEMTTFAKRVLLHDFYARHILTPGRKSGAFCVFFMRFALLVC